MAVKTQMAHAPQDVRGSSQMVFQKGILMTTNRLCRLRLCERFIALSFLFGAVACNMQRDDCADAGGRWNEIIDECECTYEDRGSYSINPTPEELERCSKTPRTDEEILIDD